MRAVTTIRQLSLATLLMTGCGADTLSVVPTELATEGELDFGTAWVNEQVARSLWLSAPHGAISVSSITSDSADLSFTWDGAPLELDDGEVEVVVTWTPSVSGTLEAPVEIASDAIENGQASVATSGTAIDPVGCDSDNPCIEMVWDPIEEVCNTTYTLAPCQDSDVCTVDEYCAFGYCKGRFDVTADPSCDPATCTPGATVVSDPFTNRWVEEFWSDGPNNVWVAGADGLIIRWDGQNWSVIETCTQEDLYSIWGTPGGDIWAAGRAGTILHWDGDAWATETPPTSVKLWGIWADDDGVWAVGDEGVSVHRDASGWSAEVTGTDLTLYSVWGTDPDHAWAVGDLGTILYWGGSSWVTQQSFVGEELYAVRGLSSDHILAVGGAGAISRFDGSVWTEENSETSDTLFAVALVHSGEYWVSGHEGVMRHYHYGVWDDHTNALGANMYALWANASDEIWLGGSAGKVWRWSGAELMPQP